jgi:hypothetical protein
MAGFARALWSGEVRTAVALYRQGSTVLGCSGARIPAPRNFFAAVASVRSADIDRGTVGDAPRLMIWVRAPHAIHISASFHVLGPSFLVWPSEGLSLFQ